MAQLNFNVMDDLIESRRTFDNFIAAPNTREVIEEAITIMAESIKNGGQVISAGNGGSMCDAMHFAEELTGRYRLNRPSLPAVFDFVFSRFLEGVGKKGDVFLGISTSGNSRNIIEACRVCKERQMKSICLLGKDGGKLKNMCDLPIIVPHEGFADRIQEVHTTIIHIFIRGLEALLTAEQMGQA